MSGAERMDPGCGCGLGDFPGVHGQGYSFLFPFPLQLWEHGEGNFGKGGVTRSPSSWGSGNGAGPSTVPRSE